MLSVRALSVRRGEVPLFRPLDFDLAPGEWLVLSGLNGAGKTTLLRVLAGLTDTSTLVTEGSLRSSARTLGVVFQQPRLFPWLSALENLTLVLRAAGWSPRDATLRGEQLLASLGLARKAALRPHQLSSGMQQRIAAARAVAVRPQLLLLDEPFSAQDAAALPRFAAWLAKEARAADAAVVLASHVDAGTLHPCHQRLTLRPPERASALDEVESYVDELADALEPCETGGE